jgi:hypothetical protein
MGAKEGKAHLISFLYDARGAVNLCRPRKHNNAAHRMLLCVASPRAHGFDWSAVLFHRFGVHLHEASSDKLKDLVGEPRNGPSVGAAIWRVRE